MQHPVRHCRGVSEASTAEMRVSMSLRGKQCCFLREQAGK